MQLEPGDTLVAWAGAECFGGQWVHVDARQEDYSSGGDIGMWVPDVARAKRLAAAINAAWPEPALAYAVCDDDTDAAICTDCGTTFEAEPGQAVCDRCRADDWENNRDAAADHRHEQARERRGER